MPKNISPSSPAAICTNCQAALSGQFCAQCGQDSKPTLKYFGTVILHLLNDIFSFDSRARRTLYPLLFKPGFLTKEYFAGRRVYYVPPLRLYLFISILFFLSLKFFAIEQQFISIDAEQPETPQQQQQNATKTKQTEQPTEHVATPEKSFSIGNQADGSLRFSFLSAQTNQQLSNAANRLGQKATTLLTSDSKLLLQQMIAILPQLMFVLLPIFALILKLLFFYRKHLYVEHLTVALHSHSFLFLGLLLIELLSSVQMAVVSYLPMIATLTGFTIVLIAMWMPCYLFLMQRRVYQQNLLFSAINYFLLSISYVLLLTLFGLIAFIWGLIQA